MDKKLTPEKRERQEIYNWVYLNMDLSIEQLGKLHNYLLNKNTEEECDCYAIGDDLHVCKRHRDNQRNDKCKKCGGYKTAENRDQVYWRACICPQHPCPECGEEMQECLDIKHDGPERYFRCPKCPTVGGLNNG